MGCIHTTEITNGIAYHGFQCGAGYKTLPEDSQFDFFNCEPPGPVTHLYMNKMEISDVFDYTPVPLSQIDRLSEGWPQNTFSIKIMGMMSELTYERTGKMQWQLVNHGPGMAAY